MTLDQAGFPIRCEWGEPGIRVLRDASDAVVIVDVLSFSTCVDVATAAGIEVIPFAWMDPGAAAFAKSRGAVLAGPRSAGGPSLSPGSLLALPRGARVVLPSPNGSRLSLAAGEVPTFAGCLRNARAVAGAALAIGPRVAVIPAGERWPDGSLRLALEDWLGAGAILRHLPGTASPEARAAVASFEGMRGDLHAALLASGSGSEIASRGYHQDIEYAAALEVSACAPRLLRGAYANAAA